MENGFKAIALNPLQTVDRLKNLSFSAFIKKNYYQISIVPSNTVVPGPSIITGLLPSPLQEQVTVPPRTCTLTVLSVRPFKIQATVVAQHPVPQARVSPVPLSQTLM